MFTYRAHAKQIIKTISAGSATLPASLIELSNVTIGFWHIMTRKQIPLFSFSDMYTFGFQILDSSIELQ